jgi:hypothetical protein
LAQTAERVGELEEVASGEWRVASLKEKQIPPASRRVRNGELEEVASGEWQVTSDRPLHAE